MKTTDNAQKTENRNFENSFVKTFAVVLSFVLISFAVSANGNQSLVNNSFGAISVQMVNQGNAEVSHPSKMIANSVNFFNETAMDNKLEVESWMIDNSYFNTNLFSDQTIEDAPLKVEAWMLGNPNFSASNRATEIESGLKVESWMTNKTIWGR